jgi:hypothetical protein
VSGKQSSAVLSGQQSSNTAGGEKAPRRESVLEEMQSGTANHGDDAAQTISDSDSDCKVTGTSQVTILSGDTAGPTRQSEDDGIFTAKVNFQSLPAARPASPAESHKRVTREHSHSPPKTNKNVEISLLLSSLSGLLIRIQSNPGLLLSDPDLVPTLTM